MEKFDHYGRQAIEILNSSKLAEALDLSKEDPRILERYGPNDPQYHLKEPVPDGAPRMIRNLCVARRLVEAGARVVSLNYTRWDWHGIDGNGGLCTLWICQPRPGARLFLYCPCWTSSVQPTPKTSFVFVRLS